MEPLFYPLAPGVQGNGNELLALPLPLLTHFPVIIQVADTVDFQISLCSSTAKNLNCLKNKVQTP